MNPEIRVNTISISKLGNTNESFNKYDIEVSLEEIENTETETKIKYEITLLSNPKNIRISLDGVSFIRGSSSEMSQFLEQDENHIPRILHSIYQELFPLLYTNSLAMQIPCPSYKLAQISSPIQTTATRMEENISNTNNTTDDLLTETEVNVNNVTNMKEDQKPEIEIPTS